MAGKESRLILEEILEISQINSVLNQIIGEDVSWDLKGSEVRPASDGLAGFLGDHKKATLNVEVQGEMKKLHLFIKRIPPHDEEKAEFINKNNYFRKEKLMFSVLEEICKNGPEPWCAKAYIYTDSILVMPDLSVEGYTTRHYLDPLDLEHVLLTTTSIARFHAAFVNYETKKSIDLNYPYRTSQEYGHLLVEPTFSDSCWHNSCGELSVSILKHFSSKAYHNIPDLKTKLSKLYSEASGSLIEYKDTLNILLHKDLWVNNIMFKYENGVPINAMLIDYQCLRYGPPAFDMIVFLYLTTNRKFREANEKVVFDHYYTVFTENLSEDSKKRLKGLKYDKESFLEWCEKARMFGVLEAIGMYPFILMDPKIAEENFDEDDEDRSEQVIEQAAKCDVYREKNLEVSEEFVERYVLK